MIELNVAVWGLGPHAIKNILPAVASLPGLRLYGVCSRSTDVVAAVSQQYACVGWSDPEELLGDARVDVVYLVTPIGLHAVQGRAVLAAGKHLWCEKPLAERPDQVEPLVALSRDRRLTLAEGFMYLHHPQFEALQALVRSSLGQVHTVTCRFGIPTLVRPGFRINRGLGGGAFLDVGAYPISAMVALFSTEEPCVAFAEICTPPGSPVDTDGRAIFRYPDGCSGVLEWRTGTAYRNEIDVWGTQGSVYSERIFSKPADYAPKLRVLDAQGNARYDSVEMANHFLRMFSAFRGFVENEEGAEEERTLIERRARLVGAVQDYCKQGSESSGKVEAHNPR